MTPARAGGRAARADFYATSAYKWSGPHIGAVIASPALLETLRPDKLVPSPDTVPERFELGTLPFADLAGVAAAVDHLAALDSAAAGARRERVLASMAAAQAHEQRLFAVLLGGLDGMRHVTTYGKAAARTATACCKSRTDAGQIAERTSPGQCLERGQLRLGGDRSAWHQGVRQRCAGLPGALQRRLGRRQAAGGGLRAWLSRTRWAQGQIVRAGRSGQRIPVDAGVALLEAEPLVEPAGGHPRRPGGQVHGPGARRPGNLDGLAG
jgi:hypothetical protein